MSVKSLLIRSFHMMFILWTVTGFSPISTCNRKSFSTRSRLDAGGFGVNVEKVSGGKKKKKNAAIAGKLKPKKQWDRYSDLKKENKIRVGVRIIDDGENDNQWFEVGRIKSKDNSYTEIGVYKQRAIIAEHAKRLYPLKFSNKISIQWGYILEVDGDEEWKVIDKASVTDDVEGIEKLIGFEGFADKSSGFYCVYDGGKLKVGEETSFK